jgi:hypothetical protein
MQLEDVQAVIRPRNPWEATDLGILLARRWWWPLTKLWLVVMLPVFVLTELLNQLVPTEGGWLGLLLLWWLKPLGEVLQLQWLSQALFGQQASVWQLLQVAPNAWKRQLPAALLWARLSRYRSLDAPVRQLEGLSGGRARERFKLLHSDEIDPCTWLVLGGAHLEAIIWGSVLLLANLLVPEELSSSVGTWLNSGAWLLQLLENSSYFVAMLLVAPFYVASGFALYVNRRIKLEGWDLELAFRRLVKRQQKPPATVLATLLLVMIGSVPLIPSADVYAADATVQAAEATAPVPVATAPVPVATVEQAQQTIATVLDGEDFHELATQKVPVLFDGNLEDSWWYRLLKRWLAKDDGSPEFTWLAQLSMWLEFLLWVLVILLVLLLAHHYRAWLKQWLLPASKTPQAAVPLQQRQTPRTAVAASPLEQQVVAESRALWAQGEQEAALAVLYRGVLHYAGRHYRQHFSESSTEGEHLQSIRAVAAPEQGAYFSRLQRHWLYLAYGKQAPPLNQLEQLWHEWPAQWPVQNQGRQHSATDANAAAPGSGQ